MPSFPRIAAALAIPFALAACQQRPASPAPPRLPDLTYGHYGPLTFDVARVDVVAHPPASPGTHIEGLAPTPPEEAIRRWVSDRIRATGSTGSLRVTIRDASLTETPLQTTQGVKGYFTNDQAKRYDGRIEVELEADYPPGRFRGTTGAIATRSVTVAEDATLYERDHTLLKLVEDMMTDINYRLETGALSNLGPAMGR